jgi:hypothetical protein
VYNFFVTILVFIKIHWIVVIFVLIYAVLLINKILFEVKIFSLDLQGLMKKGNSEVAAMQTKMIREGTARYSSQTADGIVKAVQDNSDEEILRRKLKYRHDLINSFFTAVTQFFGK